MKRILTILFVLACIPLGLQAQDYQIGFTGSGLSTTVDSVQVLNIAQGISLTVYSSDVLHLVDAITNIETQFTGKEPLHMYPNPSREKAKIEFYNQKEGQVYVEIFDVTGKIVTRNTQELKQGSHQFEISGLNQGIYMVNVLTLNGKYTGKLLSNSENSGTPSITYQGKNYSSDQRSVLKSTQNIVQMQYNDGEILKFTGKSGDYSTIVVDIPKESKTITFSFIQCIDGDNNSYPVILIGSQIWMAKDLRTTHYVNGTSITKVSDDSSWNSLELTDAAYCWYNNDSVNYADTYGALYTWPAAMYNSTSWEERGACPIGWHIPTYYHWLTLIDFLGGKNIAGGKMKEAYTMHWETPNEGATNSSGFTALPGGIRNDNGVFSKIGRQNSWWASSWDNIFGNGADVVNLTFDSSGIILNHSKYNFGYSVRCVKDSP